MEYVYIFQYNPCIHESVFATISLHKTRSSAYKAMKRYITDEYNEWRECGIRYGKQTHKYGEYEAWRIKTMVVLD